MRKSQAQSNHANYERLKATGHATGRRGPNWNKTKRVHTCCGSKGWYHKPECKFIKDVMSDDLSDLKDI